jgi:hypothetical protein
VEKYSIAFNLRPEHGYILSEHFFRDDQFPAKNTTLMTLVDRLQRVFGDLAFTCPVTSFASQLTQTGRKVYVYEFGQRSKASPWGEWMGSAHGDEYVFVFGHPVRYPDRYSFEDIELSRRIISIWSQFAMSKVNSIC